MLYVNGRRHEVRGDAAFMMLADFLRYEMQLTGTKIVCAEGDCGACTVLRSRGKEFIAQNSCIATVAQLDCVHVLTVESLADKGELHEVQKAMMSCNGSQCGFCTPGFTMAMAGYFENRKEPQLDPNKIKNQLTGNLCRCTGYQPIIEAGMSVKPGKNTSLAKRYHSAAIDREFAKARKIPVQIESARGMFLAPTKVAGLAAAKAKYKNIKVLSGGTDLGVLINKGKLFPPGEKMAWLSLHMAPELANITCKKNVVSIGATATLHEVERALETKLPEFSRMLRIFASPQIKNAATLVGNIANGSPIGDTLPALAVLDAELKLQSKNGSRWVSITKFYRGYKVFDLKPGELITEVRFTLPKKGSYFKLYKVSQRKDLDISFVSSAYLIEVERGKVVKACIAYGGVAGTVVRLPKIEKQLLGANWSLATLEAAAEAVSKQVSPRSDVRGSAGARSILTKNLFRKFSAEVFS